MFVRLHREQHENRHEKKYSHVKRMSIDRKEIVEFVLVLFRVRILTHAQTIFEYKREFWNLFDERADTQRW